jgi:hypothetical protein
VVKQLALGVVFQEPSARRVGVSLGVGQAGVWGGAMCHRLGGGASCMGWAATLRDVAGQGGLFCIGGSVVAGGLEPSG